MLDARAEVTWIPHSPRRIPKPLISLHLLCFPLCPNWVTFPPFLLDSMWICLFFGCRRAALLVPRSISARVTLHVVVVLMCFLIEDEPRVLYSTPWSSLFSCFAFSCPVGVFPSLSSRSMLLWALPWGGRIKQFVMALASLYVQT